MNRPSDMPLAHAEPIRQTYEDFLKFPDDGLRHELIDGEHVVTPSPVSWHQRLASRLIVALGKHLEAEPVGEVFGAPFDVILSEHDVVEPDVLYVSNERREIVRDWVHGAPDLVIEILSPATRRRDELQKRDLYDRYGVREYWIVDPDGEAVTAYRRGPEGGFLRGLELRTRSGDLLETPLLPGLCLALQDLFRA
jgi:Uma2 family endonuclease